MTNKSWLQQQQLALAGQPTPAARCSSSHCGVLVLAAALRTHAARNTSRQLEVCVPIVLLRIKLKGNRATKRTTSTAAACAGAVLGAS